MLHAKLALGHVQPSEETWDVSYQTDIVVFLDHLGLKTLNGFLIITLYCKFR